MAIGLIVLGLVVLADPLSTEAQQKAKVPRIGWLTTGSAASAPLNEAFRQGLRDRGYVEGENIVIEYRSAEKVERLPALAAELVQLNVDVLFAGGGAQSALAAKNATTTIPIVITAVADPVAFGLVDDLARPRGNVTGLSASPGPELHGKRLELLKDTLPKLAHAAVLWDPNNPGSVVNKGALDGPARSLGITLQFVEVRNPADLEQAFSVVRRARAEALVTLNSRLIVSLLTRIVDLTAKNRLPAIHMDSRWAKAGGLMSYGPSYLDLYQRAAGYVDKILKGAKPSELPIEQPTKFELVLNLKAARALGLTIPQALLLRANQIIE